MYGTKWTDAAATPEAEALRDAAWMEEIKRLTATDLTRGLSQLHLDHPDWPPTPLAFRQLCERLKPPPYQRQRLADKAPRYDRAKAQAELQRLKALVYQPQGSLEERIAEYDRLRREYAQWAADSVMAWRQRRVGG